MDYFSIDQNALLKIELAHDVYNLKNLNFFTKFGYFKAIYKLGIVAAYICIDINYQFPNLRFINTCICGSLGVKFIHNIVLQERYLDSINNHCNNLLNKELNQEAIAQIDFDLLLNKVGYPENIYTATEFFSVINEKNLIIAIEIGTLIQDIICV